LSIVSHWGASITVFHIIGELILGQFGINDFQINFRIFVPPPASPKIAGAILGEVQVGVIGIAWQVLILSRTHVNLTLPQFTVSVTLFL
jgi:hypothetical protein